VETVAVFGRKYFFRGKLLRFWWKLFQFPENFWKTGQNWNGFGQNCFSFWKTFENLARTKTVLVKTVSVFGKLLKTWPELKRFWWKLFYFPENFWKSGQNWNGFGENCFSFRKTFENLTGTKIVLVETVTDSSTFENQARRGEGCRGRNAGHPAPPAQIPASGFPAQGSCFRYWRAGVLRIRARGARHW